MGSSEGGAAELDRALLDHERGGQFRARPGAPDERGRLHDALLLRLRGTGGSVWRSAVWCPPWFFFRLFTICPRIPREICRPKRIIRIVQPAEGVSSGAAQRPQSPPLRRPIPPETGAARPRSPLLRRSPI